MANYQTYTEVPKKETTDRNSGVSSEINSITNTNIPFFLGAGLIFLALCNTVNKKHYHEHGGRTPVPSSSYEPHAEYNPSFAGSIGRSLGAMPPSMASGRYNPNHGSYGRTRPYAGKDGIVRIIRD